MEVLAYECLNCCLNQIMQVTEMLGFDPATREQVVRESLSFLSAADYSQSTPAVMGDLWRVLTRHAYTNDPYGEVKALCNREAEKMAPQAEREIRSSRDPFATALKYAIAGNLIDFAMADCISPEEQNARIAGLVEKPLSVDHSAPLREALSKGKTLLYICDNAGEVVFDRLFLSEIKRQFPSLCITCGVRGSPVINDATMADALEAGLDRTATLLDSGDVAAGAVLSRASRAFQIAFSEADVVITKGQGNFESLGGVVKDNLFFLFMAKCKPVADALGLPRMSVVCLQNPKGGFLTGSRPQAPV